MEERQSECPIRDPLVGVVLGSAVNALQSNGTVKFGPLKDDFDVLVKAGLAHIVGWLRHRWIPIITDCFGDLGSINKESIRDFEKRITPTLRDEFLHHAQLLQCLEVTLLQLAHLETVSEESFLSLQNLLIHLRNFDGNQVAIPNADHRRTEILCGDKSPNG